MAQAPKDQAAISNYFLLLDPQDNILICTATAAKGVLVMIDGQRVTLPQATELGHKIARHRLVQGDKVLRYGFPIGTMAARAEIGEHVHQHNLKSDYLPAHGRGGLDQGAGE